MASPLTQFLPMRGFLPLANWITYLKRHPDQWFADFLQRGITYSFFIEVDRSVPLQPPPDNLPSAATNPQVVSSLIVNSSAPPWASVNEDISAELPTLHYIKVSQAAALISKCDPFIWWCLTPWDALLTCIKYQPWVHIQPVFSHSRFNQCSLAVSRLKQTQLVFSLPN